MTNSGIIATLPSCDVCEDDHASAVLADGTTVCARDGIDQCAPSPRRPALSG